MKKLVFLFLGFLLLSPLKSEALFGESDGLNLYKDIDEGIQNYSAQLTLQEIRGGKGASDIAEQINKRLAEDGLGECINENISYQDIVDINDGKITPFFDIVSDECKIGEDKSSLPLVTQNTIGEVIKKYYKESKNVAQKKIEKINSIGNVGIYSDGIKENSSFDLINDIQEINSIVFASKTEYKGESFQSFSDDIFDGFDEIQENDKSINGKINLTPIDTLPSPIDNRNQSKTKHFFESGFICQNNNSGLDQDSIDSLFKGSNSRNNSDGGYVRQRGDDTYLGSYGSGFTSDYTKVTDNSTWGCEGIFCIKVDFETYNHQLLGGADNITIEYLLNRSNKHLGRYASTSLLPSNMTVNNFELGFKDLQLSDLLHLGIQINKKPVPLLQLEKEDKKDNTELSAKNMLYEYYKNKGLDYDRRNDLQNIKNKDPEDKSINNSQGENIVQSEKRMNQYNQYLSEIDNKNDYLSKEIAKIAAESSMDQFRSQFTELTQFTYSLSSYIENLDTIIKKIKEIPVDIN